MTTQHSQQRKKTVKKNEYAVQQEIKKPIKVKDGGIQALLFFVFAIMILCSLITYNPTDTGVNNNVTDVVHNALGRGGAHFASYMIQAFGAASYILPLLFLGFSITRFCGQSVSIYKIFGVFFVLVLFSIFSATTNFIVIEEKAGGLIGEFLHRQLSNWIGSVGIMIVLMSSIPIFAQLLFNVSLLHRMVYVGQTIYTMLKKAFYRILNVVRKFLFSRKMSRLYANMQESVLENEDKQDMQYKVPQNNESPKKRSVIAFLTRYLGIKIDESKNEEVFEDLMGLSYYDAQHTTISTHSRQENESLESEDLIHLPIYSNRESHSPSFSISTKEVDVVNIHMNDNQNEDTVGISQSVLPDVALLSSAPKHTLSSEEKQRIKNKAE